MSSEKIEHTVKKKKKTKESHLLIWVRIIVESNPTVICDFREIFIIKLLQADVVGWPGNTQERVYSLQVLWKNTDTCNMSFPSVNSPKGNFFLIHAHTLIKGKPALTHRLSGSVCISSSYAEQKQPHKHLLSSPIISYLTLTRSGTFTESSEWQWQHLKHPNSVSIF